MLYEIQGTYGSYMKSVCKCLKCNTLLWDENPNDNSIRLDDLNTNLDIKDMDWLNDQSMFYYACPECKTDEYLIDITDLSQIQKPTD